MAGAGIRLFWQPTGDPAIGVLLHDVGEFVGEQVPSLFMIGLVLSAGEEHVLAGGKRPRPELAREGSGLCVGMYPDTAERPAEPALHEPQSVWPDWLSPAPRGVLDHHGKAALRCYEVLARVFSWHSCAMDDTRDRLSRLVIQLLFFLPRHIGRDRRFAHPHDLAGHALGLSLGWVSGIAYR
jgi:hypothetical protein